MGIERGPKWWIENSHRIAPVAEDRMTNEEIHKRTKDIVTLLRWRQPPVSEALRLALMEELAVLADAIYTQDAKDDPK